MVLVFEVVVAVVVVVVDIVVMVEVSMVMVVEPMLSFGMVVVPPFIEWLFIACMAG